MKSVVTLAIYFLIFATAIANDITSVKRYDTVTRLLDPKRYDAKMLPDFDEDYATNVSVKITVRDMYAISDSSMDYSVGIFLKQRWMDERLSFQNLSTFEKLELGVANMDRVWMPDTFFLNEKRASVHTVTTPNKLMHIYRNGTVVYSMRITMTLGCDMDLRLYPFDSQVCKILIQSFAHSINNIFLMWHKPRGFSVDTAELPQFWLEPNPKLSDFMMDFSMGEFSTLGVELVIHRKVGHYILSVFLPSILLVMLSWVSFWVDPNAVPARVSLGVTCVLTMTTQSAGNRQTLPPVSYVKMIDIWMFVCLLFVFAALLEFAYVNMLLRTKEDIEQASKAAVDGTDSGDNEKKQRTKRGLFCMPSSSVSQAKRVDNLSKILFPGSFAVFLIVFVLVGLLAPRP